MRRFALMLAPLTAACATVTSAAPPAAVAVLFDGDRIEPVVVEGLADRKSARAVAANDPVRIASISKLVMALATLRLVEEGVVDLDADVSDYLGWPLRHPDYPDVPVTLGQLLMHRAALRDDAGYVVPLGESLRAKLDDPAAWYRSAPPGEAPFAYANLNSPVVATVLEAASGERYDRLLERTVFAPLGVDACLNWIGCGPSAIGRGVVLYRSDGSIARDGPDDRPPNCTIPVSDGVACDLAEYVPGTNASIFSPQGGVRIGMVDLARLGQALLREDAAVFPRRMMNPARDAVVLGSNSGERFFCRYGLGMQVIEAEGGECDDILFGDGLPRIGHAGEAYGLRSGLWFSTTGEPRGIAYFVTAVPDRTAPEEGGFAPEEKALVRRAIDRSDQAVE